MADHPRPSDDRSPPRRAILHVDMDAFYAAVEVRERPGLAGRPVVVGGRPEQRGVVAAASYEARRYGVHSAMPSARALRLCPEAVFLPSRMDLYARVSREIRAVFARYTPLVEPLSLDEAFLDVTASERLFGDAVAIARRIKDEIRAELGLGASVGVAPNKFLAKLASDLDKPDGLVVVPPGGERAFLDPLPVTRVWGVGRAAERGLAALGVHTVADLRAQPRERLVARFGRWGERLWSLARGIDDRPVVPDHAARSISHETTFAADVADREVLRACLLALAEQVGRRVRRAGLRAATVHVKVRFEDFRTVTRAARLPAPSASTADLWQAARRLLDRALGPSPAPVRLIGMGATDLAEPAAEQGDLFEAEARVRRRRVDDVTDEVSARFGAGALRRGGTLRR